MKLFSRCHLLIITASLTLLSSQSTLSARVYPETARTYPKGNKIHRDVFGYQLSFDSFEDLDDETLVQCLWLFDQKIHLADMRTITNQAKEALTRIEKPSTQRELAMFLKVYEDKLLAVEHKIDEFRGRTARIKTAEQDLVGGTEFNDYISKIVKNRDLLPSLSEFQAMAARINAAATPVGLTTAKTAASSKGQTTIFAK